MVFVLTFEGVVVAVAACWLSDVRLVGFGLWLPAFCLSAPRVERTTARDQLSAPLTHSTAIP